MGSNIRLRFRRWEKTSHEWHERREGPPKEEAKSQVIGMHCDKVISLAPQALQKQQHREYVLLR